MEKMLEEKAVEKAVEFGYGKAISIVKKGLFFSRNYPEIRLNFALVFDFYELPLLDDAIGLVESSLMEYKVGSNTLKIDDLEFSYFISYEEEEDYSPPEDDTMYEEPYISLMEILFWPKNNKKRIEGKEQVEKLIISGIKLRNIILNRLKKDEKTNCVLKVRSDNLMIAIESDFSFVNKIYERILNELQKNKAPQIPYITISKGINNKGNIIIPINDSIVAQSLIRSLT
jgi:hypothetical protein